MRVLLLAGLAAAVLPLTAAPAVADHVDAQCRFETVKQATITGTRSAGVAYGFVVARGDTPAIRCAVFVDGVEMSSTPYGPATHDVAATAGSVSYESDPAQYVQLCPVVTTVAHGERTYCPYPRVPQLPPQEIVDLVNGVFETYSEDVEPYLCNALADLAPGYPPVGIRPDGDLYVNGEFVYDCPPWEPWTAG
jgi:hypothetical protein